MPFLHTLDGLDLLPLQTLVTIIWYAPDELESTVSHLALAGGLTEDQRTSLPLIHLKQRYPEAASVIEALPWIQTEYLHHRSIKMAIQQESIAKPRCLWT